MLRSHRAAASIHADPPSPADGDHGAGDALAERGAVEVVLFGFSADGVPDGGFEVGIRGAGAE